MVLKKLTAYQWIAMVFAVISLSALLAYAGMKYSRWKDREALNQQNAVLIRQMETAGEWMPDEDGTTESSMTAALQVLYEQNPDIVGWLVIEDTVINYPVMQNKEDEEYYLRRDFYGKDNRNGCLFVDSDSSVGVGSMENGYSYSSGKDLEIYTPPSTNLLIYGHDMKSGDMFGGLIAYQDEEYGKTHNKISFDTLYEHRDYELISVFYSQVYDRQQETFKYYEFFQADTEEEFDDWYQNIKTHSLYDCDVTAEFGDEFITLSTCAYHVDNGRFVVVGKRV